MIFTVPLTSRDCAEAASAKPVSGAFDLLGSLDQEVLARRRQRIAGLSLFEERKAQRSLQRGDSSRHRRLTDAQRSRGRKRAPVAGDGKKVSEVVPVEHQRPF